MMVTMLLDPLARNAAFGDAGFRREVDDHCPDACSPIAHR
jgi:hypothetical protein